MNREQFTNYFNNTLQNLAKRQLQTENTDMLNYLELTKGYTELINLAFIYKNYVLQDSNLFENVKCILKYNRKYINEYNQVC